MQKSLSQFRDASYHLHKRLVLEHKVHGGDDVETGGAFSSSWSRIVLKNYSFNMRIFLEKRERPLRQTLRQKQQKKKAINGW